MLISFSKMRGVPYGGRLTHWASTGGSLFQVFLSPLDAAPVASAIPSTRDGERRFRVQARPRELSTVTHGGFTGITSSTLPAAYTDRASHILGNGASAPRAPAARSCRSARA